MALGVFSRLKEGLTRSTQKLGEGLSNLTAVVRNRRLDDEALEELEDALISADLGTEVARRVIGSFRRSRFGKEVTDEEIRQALADELAAILEPVAHPLRLAFREPYQPAPRKARHIRHLDRDAVHHPARKSRVRHHRVRHARIGRRFRSSRQGPCCRQQILPRRW